MRILHITTALPPDGKGGQENCVMKIINHFQFKLDIQVLIKEGIVYKGNYQIHTFNQKFRVKNILGLIKKMVNSMKSVDLIHFHYNWTLNQNQDYMTETLLSEEKITRDDLINLKIVSAYRS